MIFAPEVIRQSMLTLSDPEPWAANRAPMARTSILAAQMLQRLVDALDGDDFHAIDALLGFVGGGDDSAMEAKFRRLAQSLLTALHGPDFARQANFTKD
jgi:hypothetical protein